MATLISEFDDRPALQTPEELQRTAPRRRPATSRRSAARSRRSRRRSSATRWSARARRRHQGTAPARRNDCSPRPTMRASRTRAPTTARTTRTRLPVQLPTNGPPADGRHRRGARAAGAPAPRRVRRRPLPAAHAWAAEDWGSARVAGRATWGRTVSARRSRHQRRGGRARAARADRGRRRRREFVDSALSNGDRVRRRWRAGDRGAARPARRRRPSRRWYRAALPRRSPQEQSTIPTSAPSCVGCRARV